MVFEVTRLRLHTIPHSRENKHQSRHSFEKRSSQHERKQQGCATPKKEL